MTDENAHARNTLAMLRQADRDGIDVDPECIEELEAKVEGDEAESKRFGPEFTDTDAESESE